VIAVKHRDVRAQNAALQGELLYDSPNEDYHQKQLQTLQDEVSVVKVECQVDSELQEKVEELLHEMRKVWFDHNSEFEEWEWSSSLQKW
jgi:hypothetical protein